MCLEQTWSLFYITVLIERHRKYTYLPSIDPSHFPPQRRKERLCCTTTEKEKKRQRRDEEEEHNTTEHNT